jgi:ubiquinone/menaquinone biosynthesis C-methylase UbiE
MFFDRDPGGAGHGEAADRRPYALGYSEHEFKRLERQGAFLRGLTEDVLRRAGIAPGMRVLDIGCGVGDVVLIATELVGPAGFVLGIDRSPEAIMVASQRAAGIGQNRVHFAALDLDQLAPEGQFDAVIGRLILLYLKDPAALLRRLSRCLRPGGIVALQEMAMPTARSVPDGPLFAQCRTWIIDAIGRAGFETDMGGKLLATFQDAGLPEPQMIAAARVEGGAESFVFDYLALTLRSLLPVMERLGVATAADVQIETLAERLRQEALQHRASVMPPLMIGAWTRMPEHRNDIESLHHDAAWTT